MSYNSQEPPVILSQFNTPYRDPLRSSSLAVSTSPEMTLHLMRPDTQSALSPAFGQGRSIATTLKSGMNYVADKVYGSEGTRYLTEQTVGFTIPRMIQQLLRNEHITGTLNTIAAWEMFARDISADLMDTIAPGIMARFVIGAGIDHFADTLTKRMMGGDALQLYTHAAQNTSNYSGFIQHVENKLKTFAQNSHGTPIDQSLDLETHVKRLMAHPKKGLSKAIDEVAKQLADHLKLDRLDIELVHPNTDNTHQTVSMTLNELVGDLKALKENYTHKHLSKKGAWNQVMPDVLNKTRKLSQWHMVANIIALAGSLAVPLLIRMATKAMTGLDAFPGTTALRNHFKRHDNVNKTNATETETPATESSEPFKKEKMVWFPYLKECWEKRNWKPLAITAGFFTVLLGTVYRNQFLTKGMKKLNWKNIVKAYEFDRGFPWTTVAQMELTYGLLCGFRLATARDRNEFNEAGLRDALLGWPTLTYGFPLMRKLFFYAGNKLLKGKGALDMLMKGASKNSSFWKQSVRTTDEMQASFLQRSAKLQNGQNITSLLDRVKTTANILTLSAAGISIYLLSWLEPKWGINWTTKLELAERRKELKELAGSLYENTRSRLQLGAERTQQLAHEANVYAKEHFTLHPQPAFDPTQSPYYQQAQRAIALDQNPYFAPKGPIKVAGQELQRT